MKSNLMKLVLSTALYASTISFAYAGYPININTANAPQIAEALDGIGPKKAEAIIEFRKTHGNFVKAEDLLKVKGIGEKMLDKNREFILLK